MHPSPPLYADPMDPSDYVCPCPVCDRQMRLTTVLRPTAREETLVLQCRPCGVSTTKTIAAPEGSPTLVGALPL